MRAVERLRGWRPDRRRAAYVAIPLAVAAAAGGVIVDTTGSSDAEAADGADGAATVEVARRDLVQRETFSGTLGYADERPLLGQLSGTVTRVVAAGAVVRRGDTLMRVDEAPVVLMYGSIPVWRTMQQGDEGADVRQLERNLAELGYDADGAMDVDGDYEWATAEAVRDWQEALGIDETGAVEQGQVVFAPGARRVASVKATLGSRTAPGQPAMTTTSTRRAVSVALDARRQELVRDGVRGRVTLPGGETVDAVVSEVGAAATAAEEGAATTIEVTLTLASQKGVTALDAAPVEVDLTRETAENVLSVPVTALLALAGGGYGLEVVAGGQTSIVAVEVGTFADGYVEVSGPGIEPGTLVGVAE